MAEIRLEEKSGMGWLWWVLGAIVVALLLWWLLGSMGDDDDFEQEPIAAVEQTTSEPVMTQPAAPAGGVITDLTMLTNVAMASEMAGRPVALSGVPVARAVSDQAFWIGTGSTAETGVFAVRGNQMASYTASDGAVDSGATVNIWGQVAEMPDDLRQAGTEWNISSTDQSLLSSEGVYILADSVRLAGM